jgi:hypothetical protein
MFDHRNGLFLSFANADYVTISFVRREVRSTARQSMRLELFGRGLGVSLTLREWLGPKSHPIHKRISLCIHDRLTIWIEIGNHVTAKSLLRNLYHAADIRVEVFWTQPGTSKVFLHEFFNSCSAKERGTGRNLKRPEAHDLIATHE